MSDEVREVRPACGSVRRDGFAGAGPLVEVNGLSKTFGHGRGAVHAVSDVSLSIARGECVGLVGESGCGKSTLGRLLLRLEQPSAGTVAFDGRDISALSSAEMRAMRRRMQMVFQGTANAFDPYYTVRGIVEEPLRASGAGGGKAVEERVVEMLERVGLSADFLERHPGELSGGQRQRVGIARALILHPEFVVCDEVVSSIDYVLKRQVIELLRELKRDEGYTYLFISHDMAAVRAICDRVMVMYLGHLVEVLPSVRAAAAHPYTRALLASTLEADPHRRRQRRALFANEEGAVAWDGAGCPFAPRCLEATERCRTEAPSLREVAPGHLAACHLSAPVPTVPA